MRPDDDLRGLAPLLQTRRFGRIHEHHDQLGSTNDRAMRWLADGGAHGAVVTADAQTSGRGRRGRAWASPPGRDLYVSVLVRPRLPAPGFGAVSLAAGVGLREGLERHLGSSGPAVQLKWPNDLLVDGRKLGGILCESRWLGGRAELVIGFGLNVGRTEFEPELEAVATSLALLGGTPPGRAPLLADLLVGLEGSVDDFLRGGFSAIRHRYEPHCLLLGQEISTNRRVGDGVDLEVRAVAEGLDEDGALLARPVEGGSPFRVESADVWLAHP